MSLPAERWEGEFYPGSKTPVRDYARENYGPPPKTDDLGPPYMSDGTLDFWTIRTLAYLINRAPTTLRRWETNSDLPKTPWRKMNPNARTVNGEVRLYTRAMVEGLVRIAYEEGLIANPRRKLSVTKFRQRAAALFERISA